MKFLENFIQNQGEVPWGDKCPNLMIPIESIAQQEGVPENVQST